MQILNVEEKYEGKKICAYLLYKFANLKQSTLYKALRKKDIRINGSRISDNETIHTGDEIKVFISDELLFSSNITLDIVFEDKNILVINKPSGIEVTGENSLTTECENYIQGFVPIMLNSSLKISNFALQNVTKCNTKSTITIQQVTLKPHSGSTCFLLFWHL